MNGMIQKKVQSQLSVFNLITNLYVNLYRNEIDTIKVEGEFQKEKKHDRDVTYSITFFFNLYLEEVKNKLKNLVKEVKKHNNKIFM